MHVALFATIAQLPRGSACDAAPHVFCGYSRFCVFGVFCGLRRLGIGVFCVFSVFCGSLERDRSAVPLRGRWLRM
jgi:hypothetical protein